MKNKKTVYGSIAEDILVKIQNDTYPIGTLLPPERELMGIYGVERTTVRRGLDLLKNEGYIIKAAGLGSVVNSKVPVKTDENVSVASVAVVTPKEKKNKDKNILVIFPHLREIYEYRNLSFVSDVLDELKKLCNITTITSKSISETNSVIESGSFDGCVIFDDADKSIFNTLTSSSVPVCIALGLNKDFPCVIPDIFSSGEVALSVLKDNGHKTSALICGDEKSSFDKKVMGQFRFYLKAMDFEESSELINHGGKDERSGFDRLSELIRTSGSKLTAVCAFNDEAAKGALKAAKHYGTDVPSDLSVISLLSSSQNNDFDSIYVSPKSFAENILICLASKASSGCTLLTKSEYLKAGTVSTAKEASSSKRRLSDFLL